MLWYHTAQMADPAARVRAARGLLAFLLQFSPASGADGFNALLKQELGLLLVTPDSYLLHEHLEEFNEPLYFHQFAGRAAEKGLQYLGEAHLGSMVAGKFGAEADRTLRQISPDLLHMEQYMDFLRNAMFRQTLLCHADVPLDHKLRPDAVTDFYVASRVTPASPSPDLAPGAAEEFRGAGEKTLTTRDPLMKAAMLTLADAAPRPLHFDALVAAARAKLAASTPSPEAVQSLANRLLNCHLSGLVDFSVSPPGFTTEISARPVASPYARHRAAEGGKVINVLLETLDLDPPATLILRHLDGDHDAAALAALVTDWLKQAVDQANREAPPGTVVEPPLKAGQVDEYVAKVLSGLAKGAVLVA
jgi:methyltransferase-like protein